MKYYNILIITGTILIGISATLAVYYIPHSEIDKFCHPKFPPENGTMTQEQYNNCMSYPEAYGYGKK